MVKRVSLFQTTDGAHFGTEAEAKAHEATVGAQIALGVLLKKLKADGATVFVGENDGVMLESFLIDNREALLLALSGNVAKPKKATRKKKTPIPETPVNDEMVYCAAVEEPTTKEQPAEVAGDSDAQLDSLVAELGE